MNLLLAVLTVVLLVFASYWVFYFITRHGKELEVPDLSMMTVEEAARTLQSQELQLVVLDSLYIHSLPRGVVYQQNPLPASHVKKGRKIRVVINSIEPKRVRMPDLIGYSLRQAKDVLEARGLALGHLSYVNDIATNNVLGQKYRGLNIAPGTNVDSESVIDLVLGLDPMDNATYIPDVLGLSRNSAVDEVFSNSLNLRPLVFDQTVKSYTDSLNARVYRQEPSASSYPVDFGHGVTLYLTMDDSKIPAKLLK